MTISHWEGPEEAAQMIRDGIARVQGVAVAPRGRKAKEPLQRPARRATDRPAKAAKKK